MRESKTLSFQVKATGTSTNALGQPIGKIDCYGAIFNNIDDGNDRILPGAFKRTIQNSKSRSKARGNPYISKMLWQHDSKEVIGSWYDLSEDELGLHAKGDVLLTTQRGMEYYELAKAQMVDEFSIIYDVPQGGAKYDKNVRDLAEMRLFSIDPVTFAMNDETYTVGVKARKGHKMNTKDFTARYRQECIDDWQYTDFLNITTALRASVMDIFNIGDTPQSDLVDTILDDGNGAGFISALKAYVQKGIDLDVSGYLQEQQSNASSSYLGLMSRDNASMNTKAGRTISAATQQIVDDHVANLKALASAHTKAVRTAADDFADTMQGAVPTYAADPGKPDDQEGKSRTRGTSSQQETRSTPAHSSPQSDTADEEEHAIANVLDSLRALKLVKS